MRESSSLWEVKYKPQSVKDLILSEKTKSYFEKCVVDQEIPNMIFYGRPGKGKTASAVALCNDINCDVMFINGSLQTSIDVMRYDVTQFAHTSSMFGGKKVVIIDESSRISVNGLESLKGIMDAVESNCRFIFTTNDFNAIKRISDGALVSRFQGVIDFDNDNNESKTLKVNFFKRVCSILDQEGIAFDKKVVAEFVQTTYPDFRKTLNKLQMNFKTYGCIDERILSASDDTKVEELITEMKAKKFNNVRKICNDLDPEVFINSFYNLLDDHLKDSAKPSMILLINEYSFKHMNTLNKTINLVALATDIMMQGEVWK